MCAVRDRQAGAASHAWGAEVSGGPSGPTRDRGRPFVGRPWSGAGRATTPLPAETEEQPETRRTWEPCLLVMAHGPTIAARIAGVVLVLASLGACLPVSTWVRDVRPMADGSLSVERCQANRDLLGRNVDFDCRTEIRRVRGEGKP